MPEPSTTPGDTPRPQSRWRWLRGAAVAFLGAGTVFLLMANQDRVPHGTAYGALAILVAVVGLWDAMGLLRRAEGDDPSLFEHVFGPKEGEAVWASPQATVPAALLVLGVLGLVLGVSGLPWGLALSLLPLLVSSWRRPALAVFVVAAGLYLPLLGVYGLWDPWETHYGEVTREILARDDWISLWWAQDGWFWSKPILIFWAEGLLWHALWLPFQAGQFPEHVEWALRLPTFAMATGALLAVYAATARIFDRRAGLIAALVLATMPHFFFLSRQAITDMPFVANMTIAVCLLLLAFHEDPERRVRDVRVGRVALSAQHVVIGLLVVLVLPQVLYLASRNVTVIDGPLFAWHGDELIYGSVGNADVPGNPRLREVAPRYRSAQPIVQAAAWGAVLAVLVWSLRRERRAQALLMSSFYVFCGLAFMAKGIPGFALPGLVALLFLLACHRWDAMLQGRLRIATGALTVIAVGAPWFVAMFIRHGQPFLDRLLIHDHINRLAAGVHGDKGTIGYFVKQLGFAMFPWVALAPSALTGWLHLSKTRPASETPLERSRRQTLQGVALWFAAAFTLFSAMVTKFHHYIFPAVPPAAMLTGILADRALGAAPHQVRGRHAAGLAAALLAPWPIVLGLAGLRGDVRGILPRDTSLSTDPDWALQHPWSPWLCALLLVLGALLGAAAWWLQRNHDRARSAPGAASVSAAGVMLLGAAVLCAFVGRDLSWSVTDPQGYERLIHLFVYNYGRPWPEQFDYRPILTGFAATATLCFGVAAIPSLRRLGSRAVMGTALAFALWGLDVYMMDLTPHWTQRNLVERYYEARDNPQQPLVAWQMNWKGENIYTGNRVAVFVDLDNREIKRWMEQNEGLRAFFVLEHTRLGNFRRLMGEREVEPLTTERLNNKFVLVEVTL